MKRSFPVLAFMALVMGCVQTPSRDVIRAKYKEPGPLSSDLMKDPEVRDLVLKAASSGLPDGERRQLFDRFERAIDRCAKARGGTAVAFDLCVMQYHLFSNERKAALNLAAVYAAVGKRPESLELLNEALNKKDVLFVDEGNTQAGRIHRGLGGCYLERNEASKAIEHIEKALELDAKDAHSCFLLGQAYGLRWRTSRSKEDMAKAVEAMDRGFRLAPKLALPEDYSLFATLLLQQGRHKEATDVLVAAITRYPRVSAFHFNLAQYDRASGDPVRAYYLYWMAEGVRQPGDRHGQLASVAIREIDEEAEKQKDNAAYEQVRCLVRGRNLARPDGDHEQAVESFRQALKANGKNEFVLRFLLAGALAGAKKHDEAIAVYNECIKERPWFAPAYVELGRIYESKGDHPKGMQLWVRALEVQPRNWRVQEVWSKLTDEARKSAIEKLKEPAPPQ